MTNQRVTFLNSNHEQPPDRLCKGCGRPYATYISEPCRGGDCIDCRLFGLAGTGDHWEVQYDVDEVVSYQCPHGTMWDQVCKGCGAKVGGWGMGAAGFGELCGCEAN